MPNNNRQYLANLFITATDTDAGKTLVASALTAALVKQQLKVAVFKPISAGCELINDELVNEDALLLQQQANCGQTIRQINPIAFAPPIAPHIAAQQSQTVITVNDINAGFERVQELNSDIVITEGAGGWRLPLGNGQYLSNFVQQQGCDVILVVAMKLGCLNHAILTYETIINDGLNIVGWVANAEHDMPYLAENIELLTATFTAPLIAKLGHVNSIEQATSHFDLTKLLIN
jgi:dethiobiotin synthetase